jgi:membrane-associated phospholipid phosphatase
MVTGFILTAVIVVICIRYFDQSLAVFVGGLSIRSSIWHELTADIPDTLLVFVCIITIFAFAGYLARIKKGLYDENARFFRLIMYAVPVSYIVKSLLKFVFGRIKTREWLISPESYGFHWFQGGGIFGGFPSGHMAVFTALTMALWRFYPRHRIIYAVFLLVLALSLIATNYHFLSDVIAGAYLGIMLEKCTYEVLRRWERCR